MNPLDGKMEAGLAQLRTRLAGEGRSPEEIGAIAGSLGSASFPGLLAFLAAKSD